MSENGDSTEKSSRDEIGKVHSLSVQLNYPVMVFHNKIWDFSIPTIIKPFNRPKGPISEKFYCNTTHSSQKNVGYISKFKPIHYI